MANLTYVTICLVSVHSVWSVEANFGEFGFFAQTKEDTTGTYYVLGFACSTVGVLFTYACIRIRFRPVETNSSPTLLKFHSNFHSLAVAYNPRSANEWSRFSTFMCLRSINYCPVHISHSLTRSRTIVYPLINHLPRSVQIIPQISLEFLPRASFNYSFWDSALSIFQVPNPFEILLMSEFEEVSNAAVRLCVSKVMSTVNIFSSFHMSFQIDNFYKVQEANLLESWQKLVNQVKVMRTATPQASNDDSVDASGGGTRTKHSGSSDGVCSWYSN